MLPQSVIQDLRATQTVALQSQLPPLLWPALSTAEKMQLLDEVGSRTIVELAISDEQAIIRYWAIRRAGHHRRWPLDREQFVKLRLDASELVASRAGVWSYEDVDAAELGAVDSFLCGADWKELPDLAKVVQRLSQCQDPPWKKLEIILIAFFCAPGVDIELRGKGPHHGLVAHEAAKALEYIKSFAIEHDERLGANLALALPIRFHSFDLLDGWERFPIKFLSTLVVARNDVRITDRVTGSLSNLASLRSDYNELRREISEHDDRWEFEENPAA